MAIDVQLLSWECRAKSFDSSFIPIWKLKKKKIYHDSIENICCVARLYFPYRQYRTWSFTVQVEGE